MEKSYINFTKRGDNILKCVMTLLILTGIVVNDFYNYKVSNQWILLGIGAGIFFQVKEHGSSGLVVYLSGFLITLGVLFIFFLLKMFGAGDIKTLAMIGGLFGTSFSISCMLFSLFAGAIIAVLSMIRSRTAFHRFYSLYQYVSGCLYQKKVTCYPVQEAKDSGGTIHFTLAIALGFLMTLYKGPFM